MAAPVRKILDQPMYFVSPSLALMKEDGMSVLENRVPRKICGPTRMKMTARYIKLYK
jgi:hypothetical protein